MISVPCLVAIAWFVGAFINGVSGMGAAMVVMPIIAGFMDMSEAVPSSCLVGTALSGYMTLVYRRHCRLHALWPMLVGCVPGVGLGVWVLDFVPGIWLQAALGGLLLAYMIWQQCYTPAKVQPETLPAGLVTGLSAGIVGASVSFSGPPIAIYALLVGWDKNSAMGTLSAFFLTTGIIICLGQAMAGFFSPATLEAAAYGLPGATLGMLASIPAAKRIPEKQFRAMLKLLVAFAGLTCLYRTFAALLI